MCCRQDDLHSADDVGQNRVGIYIGEHTMSAVFAAECFSNVMTAVLGAASSPLTSMDLILDGSEKHEHSKMEAIRTFHRNWATCE